MLRTKPTVHCGFHLARTALAGCRLLKQQPWLKATGNTYALFMPATLC